MQQELLQPSNMCYMKYFVAYRGSDLELTGKYIDLVVDALHKGSRQKAKILVNF